jgi:hypothetical protein
MMPLVKHQLIEEENRCVSPVELEGFEFGLKKSLIILTPKPLKK